jgi:hypothetical protein
MFDAILGGVQGILQQPSIWLFFLLFFLFIIVAYKVVKLLLRALLIAVMGGLFPIFANMFLGMSIPITLGNILWFAMTGVEIYFVYVILCGIGKIAELISKPFSRGKTKKVEKVIIMEKERDRDEKKKQERDE